MINLRFDLPSHFLDGPGQRAGFVLMAAFLGSFLFIRTSARLMRSPRVPWWPGSVETSGGLHLHHLVWGIVLMLLSGFLGFAVNAGSPSHEIFAAMFGIGAGLTLDEFALWVYLQDVYWSHEGRTSFDAVVFATAIGSLILLGAAPLDIPNHSGSLDTLILTVILDVGLAGLTIYKGKPMAGVIGVFVPFVSLVGAIRLARPGSPWAKRRYAPGSKKLERATARWARIESRRWRLGDLIAGAPSVGPAAEPGSDG